MKKITISGETATIEECSFLQWTAGSFTSPFTGQPLTSQQSWLFGSACLIGGVAIGTAYGKKIKSALPGGKNESELSRVSESGSANYNNLTYA